MTLPPGWREMPDLEAEVRRLAGERAALETVPLPRRDLDVLLGAAAAVLEDREVSLPGDLSYADVEEVVQRHGRRH